MERYTHSEVGLSLPPSALGGPSAEETLSSEQTQRYHLPHVCGTGQVRPSWAGEGKGHDAVPPFPGAPKAELGKPG